MLKIAGFNITREKRSGNTLKDPSKELMEAFGILPGAVKANITTAQAISAVYQATRLVSDDIAGLPISVYQKGKDGNILPVNNALSYLLKTETDPISRATPFKFFSTSGKHMLMRGNSFAIIHRNPSTNELTRLEFIKSSDVNIFVNDSTGEPLYLIRGKVGPANGYYTSSQLLHFKGMGDDVYCGISVLRYAAQGLGIELAAQKLESSFFENGSIVRDYISYPNGLTEEGFQNVKNRWGKNHTGAKSATIAILENGGKYETVRINAEDFQFIARHGKSIAEISRWFNVPPDKLFSLEKMTYASMEQSSANYALQTLAPWCKNIEQEINIKLCDTRNGEYVKFNLNALIRADVIAQADALVKLVQGGVFDQNEARSMYEQNKKEGASELLFPLNAIPQSMVKEYYDAVIAGKIPQPPPATK